MHIPGCQKKWGLSYTNQEKFCQHILFVEKRGPIVYLAALKMGDIRYAHPYYAIFRKLHTPSPPPPPPPRNVDFSSTVTMDPKRGTECCGFEPSSDNRLKNSVHPSVKEYFWGMIKDSEKRGVRLSYAVANCNFTIHHENMPM